MGRAPFGSVYSDFGATRWALPVHPISGHLLPGDLASWLPAAADAARRDQVGPHLFQESIIMTHRDDFVGCEVPDVFASGYGIDFTEQYRHLP